MPEGIKSRYIRLHALPDEVLSARGPGRASDGNFVVSRISASFIPPGSDAEATAIRFVAAEADFEQTMFPAGSALDTDLKDGWAVSPQFGQPHVAVFEISSETVLPAGSKLKITLEQQHSDQHTLGHFQLSVAEQQNAAPLVESPARQALIKERDAQIGRAHV